MIAGKLFDLVLELTHVVVTQTDLHPEIKKLLRGMAEDAIDERQEMTRQFNTTTIRSWRTADKINETIPIDGTLGRERFQSRSTS